MKIHRLRVKDFKAIREACINFPASGVTVLEGQNETGKTSLLQAFNQLLSDKHTANAQRIKNARPLGRDAYSEIEADLEIGPVRLTIAKRFQQGASGKTTLHITGPRPESVSGDDAHNRLQQILDAHRDPTLWDALQVAQNAALDQAALRDSTALRSALDRAAGGESPDQHANDNLMAAVERELARYYTLTAGKTTGELAEAIRNDESARQEADELQERVRQLDVTTREIDRLEREVSRLEDQIGPKQQEAIDRQRDVDALKDLEEAVNRHRRDVQLATAEVERLRRLQKERTDLEQEQAKYASEVRKHEQDFEALAPELETANERYTAARDTRQQAESDLEDASQVRRRAKDDELLLRTQYALKTMEDRLREIAAINREMAANREARGTIRVTSQTIKALRDLDIEARAAERQADEGAPRVTITATGDLPISTSDSGGAVGPGETRTLSATGKLSVDIEGIASIAITPPAAAEELADARRRAHASLQHALRDAGVKDVDDAVQQLERFNDLDRKIEEAPRRINAILGDLPDTADLRAKRDRDAGRLRALNEALPPGYELPASVSDAETRARDAEERELEGQQRIASLRNEEEAARDALERIRASRDAIENKLTVLRPELARAVRALEQLRNDTADTDLADQCATANAQLVSATASLDDAQARLDAMQPDALRLAAENARLAAEGMDQKRRTTREQLAGERRILDQHTSEGLFERAEAAESRARHTTRERESIQRRAHAAKLLRDTLGQARTAAQRRYAGPLSEHIEALGRVLYGPSFAVRLTDDLTIAERILDGTPLPFDQLSGGAKEQLSILARVATAMLVDPGQGVPLVIDDALGYTDPERLRAMGSVLALAGKHCQVIVLTCYPGRYEHVGGATVRRLEAAPHAR